MIPIVRCLPVACLVENKILVVTGRLCNGTSLSSLERSGLDVLSHESRVQNNALTSSFWETNNIDMVIETSSLQKQDDDDESVCIDKESRHVSIRYTTNSKNGSSTTGFAEISGDLGVQLKVYSSLSE